MPLVVEDGSGDPDANAYASLEYVDDHHELRGNTRWETYSDPQKEAAIVRATDYLDKRFGKRFRGTRQTRDQALEWPRLSAFDDDGFLLDDVPRRMQMALAEYALRAAIYNVLAPDPPLPVPAQSMIEGEEERETAVVAGPVTSESVAVGPVREAKSYETPSRQSASNLSRVSQSSLVSSFNIPEYPEADLWLEELLNSSSSTSLERA